MGLKTNDIVTDLKFSFSRYVVRVIEPEGGQKGETFNSD